MDLDDRALVMFRWIAGVFIAVIVSVMLAVYIQRDSLIKTCERNSARAAMNATGWSRLADHVRTRANEGDVTAAKGYEAVANGLKAQIPGYHGSDAIIEVGYHGSDRTSFVLTPLAKRLQREGCKRVYPNPVPWIS